jgi:acyl-coenzyme A thioesterase PaaI-like protein
MSDEPAESVRHEPAAAIPLVRTDPDAVEERTWFGRPVPDGYTGMIDELRELLDRVATAAPSTELVTDATKVIADLNARLADYAVDDSDQVSGRLVTVPGRGQLAVPAVHVEQIDDLRMTGRVRFGRHFLGSNGAVHGGAIPLLFDDLLGRLALSGDRPRSRTAFLHVDYRSITPIDTDLQVEVHFEREDGRKRYLRGRLHCGDRLCAEASGLFVALRPGQP